MYHCSSLVINSVCIFLWCCRMSYKAPLESPSAASFILELRNGGPVFLLFSRWPGRTQLCGAQKSSLCPMRSLKHAHCWWPTCCVCSRKRTVQCAHSTLHIRLLGGGGLLLLWLLTLVISPFTGTWFLNVSKQCCSWTDIIQSDLYCSLRLKTWMVFGTMKIKLCSFFQ